MTNPEVYGNLSFEKFSHILKGDNDVELPLMSKRYDCLRESSSVLLEKYSGMLYLHFFSHQYKLHSLTISFVHRFLCKLCSRL